MRDRDVVTHAMRQVRAAGTAPEMALRKALWRRGLRYRTNSKKLLGKPDIVFSGRRLLVFVDGDYWHGNQWLRRGHNSIEEQFASVSGRDYWIRKLRRNMERDRVQTDQLLRNGWDVMRFWESDLKQGLEGCVERVVEAMSMCDCRTEHSRIPERSFAEFFAGIGLVRLALESSGWSAVFANDIDPKKHEMYRASFGDDDPTHYVLGDIHEIAASQVPKATLATASFPCTDLSLAGSRRGLRGKQSGALMGFLDLLEQASSTGPPIVMLENVPGFLSSHGGADFGFTLRRLNGLGYSVDAFFLDSVHFVPQSRNRLFVIGVHEELASDLPSVASTQRDSLARPPKLLEAMASIRGLSSHRLPLPYPPKRESNLRDVVEGVPDESHLWWDSERAAHLLLQMTQRHRRLLRHMVDAPRYTYGTIFRRARQGATRAELRVDGVAGCLRTPRGGSSRQILIKAGRTKTQIRFLTPRECARLQGVPDDFPITVGTNQALFGFGDAVCVPAIQWIADHYLNLVVTHLMRGELLCSSVSM